MRHFQTAHSIEFCYNRSDAETHVTNCSEAADLARGVGGWPASELAEIDATFPEQWWQPQALARLEGALSSLCLPGMSASLGPSPHSGKSQSPPTLHAGDNFTTVLR